MKSWLELAKRAAAAKIPAPVIIVLGLAALWFAARWFERVNLYAPSRVIPALPSSLGIKYTEIWLAAADGVRLNAWYVPPAGADKPVLVFCHGNGGNIGYGIYKMRVLSQLGFGVLAFDYRGYGLSRGRPTEKGTYLDAEAAYDYLAGTLRAADDRIIIYGESLGTAVATELALRRKAAALVLESPFTSVVELGKHFYPWLPARLLVTHKYDTLSKIQSINCPVLVLHSPGDEIVPYVMGRRVYEAAKEPKQFIELSGTHNEGYAMSGERYAKGVSNFVSKYVSAAKGGKI